MAASWVNGISPYINRFLSADSIVPNPFNPQDFNRFSYVRNNPVRYIDPSGNIPIDCWKDPSYCSNTTTLPTSPYSSNKPKLPGGGGGGGGNNNNNGGGGRGGTPVTLLTAPEIPIAETTTTEISGDTTVTLTVSTYPGAECGIGVVQDCPAAPITTWTITTVRTTSESESRNIDGMVGIASWGVQTLLGVPQYIAAPLSYLSGYYARDVNFPGSVAGDITTNTRTPLSETFECYGYPVNQILSVTTVERNEQIIYSNVSTEGYCYQR